MNIQNLILNHKWPRAMLSVLLLTLALPAHAEVTIIEEDQIDSKENLKNTIVPIIPPPVWVLTAGHTVSHELHAWGDKAGWKIIWDMQKDWMVPAQSQFTGEFPIVAADVIKTLASNGALIHARIFEGNKTMVISGPGVSE